MSAVRTPDLNPGSGNWSHFSGPLDPLFEAASDWKQELAGVEKPWLCWNVNSRWCELQQSLVKEVGWTPVVGSDPRHPDPRLLPGAIKIDFNRRLQFPNMWMHFPLDLVYLYADRLAFWHSDLLCRRENMQFLAGSFDGLENGRMAAVFDDGGWRYLLSRSRHRYWELAGCVTRAASKSLWDHGAGWWRHFYLHPNFPARRADQTRNKWNWDHGYGIIHWKRHCGGNVVDLGVRRLGEGHCTWVGRTNYSPTVPEGASHGESARPSESSQFNLGSEIDGRYDLRAVAQRLGIDDLLSDKVLR